MYVEDGALHTGREYRSEEEFSRGLLLEIEYSFFNLLMSSHVNCTRKFIYMILSV